MTGSRNRLLFYIYSDMSCQTKEQLLKINSHKANQEIGLSDRIYS